MQSGMHSESFPLSATLIIGLGGTGIEVIRQIKSQVKQNAFSNTSILEFLVLDTSPLPNFSEQESINNSDFVYLGGYNIEDILRNLERFPSIKSWWAPEEMRKGNINHGARQKRAIGRLSLHVNWHTFSQKLNKKVDILRYFWEKERLQLIRGVSVERIFTPQVYIIASICGGTGSGTLFDVAFKVRQQLGDETDITGVFLLPSSFTPLVQSTIQRKRIEANAYAVLSELNAFIDGAPFSAQFPDTNEYNRTLQNQVIRHPFDMAYLIDGTNGSHQFTDLSNTYAMIAKYISLQLLTPIGQVFNTRRVNLRDLTFERFVPNVSTVSSFVTSSLTITSNIDRSLSIRRASLIPLERHLNIQVSETLQEDLMMEEATEFFEFVDQQLKEIATALTAQDYQEMLHSRLKFILQAGGLESVNQTLKVFIERCKHRQDELQHDASIRKDSIENHRNEIEKLSTDPSLIDNMMQFLTGKRSIKETRARLFNEIDALERIELQRKAVVETYRKIRNYLEHLLTRVKHQMEVITRFLTEEGLAIKSTNSPFASSLESFVDSLLLPLFQNPAFSSELIHECQQITLDVDMEVRGITGSWVRLISHDDLITLSKLLTSKIVERLREFDLYNIANYLSWWYAHQDYSHGHAQNPLDRLKEQVNHVFLNVDWAKIGSEIRNIEHINVIGLPDTLREIRILELIHDRFDDFGIVKSTIDNSIDVSRSLHGIPISSLRDLSVMQESYTHFRDVLKQVMHPYADWQTWLHPLDIGDKAEPNIIVSAVSEVSDDNIKHYLSNLIKALQLEFTEIYPVDARFINRTQEPQGLLQSDDILDLLSIKKRSLLIGNRDSGKTTVLAHYALRLANTYQEQFNRGTRFLLPIFVQVNQLLWYDSSSFVSQLHEIIQKRLGPLKDLLSREAFVLVLDGIDGFLKHQQPQEITELFSYLNTYSQFVISVRSFTYRDVLERLVQDIDQVIELEEVLLTEEQIKTYLLSMQQSTDQDILNYIEQSGPLFKLCQKLSYLKQISRILLRGKITLSNLLRIFYGLMLEPDTKQPLALLEYIAFQLQTKGRIHVDDIRQQSGQWNIEEFDRLIQEGLLLRANIGYITFTNTVHQDYFFLRSAIEAFDADISADTFFTNNLDLRDSLTDIAVRLGGFLNNGRSSDNQVTSWLAPLHPELAIDAIVCNGYQLEDIIPSVKEKIISSARQWTRRNYPLPFKAAGFRVLSQFDEDHRSGIGCLDSGIPDLLWVRVEDLYITKYPITVRQFKAFLDDRGYMDLRWWMEVIPESPLSPSIYGNQPISAITWDTAAAFCRWLSAKLAIPIRLPSNQEYTSLLQIIPPYVSEPHASDSQIIPVWLLDAIKTPSISAVGISNTEDRFGFDFSTGIREWTGTQFEANVVQSNLVTIIQSVLSQYIPQQLLMVRRYITRGFVRINIEIEEVSYEMESTVSDPLIGFRVVTSRLPTNE